ncbi:MAG: LysR family transcriptional regulator, partial [Selenomonadaceae bacterium]|nr:LysR family transcriptional regulator [Selenomonadaceae bacterium]
DHHFVTYKETRAAFKRRRLKMNIMHETPYLHTAKNLVRQHLASTVLIRQGVLEEEFDRLVLIPFEQPFYLNSGIVVKKGRQIYPHEEVLMNYLKEIVKGAINEEKVLV